MNHNGPNEIAQEPTRDVEVHPSNEIPQIDPPPAAAHLPGTPSYARREKKNSGPDNRQVLVVAAGFVFALFLFAFALATAHKSMPLRKTTGTTGGQPASDSTEAQTNILPVADSGHSPEQSAEAGKLTADDIEHTATRAQSQESAPSADTTKPGKTLNSIPPFKADDSWSPPPPGTAQIEPGPETSAEVAQASKSEHDAMDKPSLVFVRSSSGRSQTEPATANDEVEIGLGLEPGARLRARLESAASTAVETPVIAVIEYNYERDGQIVVPAGAKALGHLQQADRAGYLSIQFDSMTMPDGSSIAIEALATDLQMRPLKGRVEGRNTGKNILVRSVSGIGEVAAMLVGRGSLNQPLSESDLLRERVSSNIGQASDEQIQQMTISEHVVVSLAANTEIYVVLRQPTKRKIAPGSSAASQAEQKTRPEAPAKTPTMEELRQLLQLQRELNEESTTKSPS